MKLITPGTSNAKTAKDSLNKIVGILHLSPATMADGKRSVCPWSTAGCREACLNTTGYASITGPVTHANLSKYSIHRARAKKTLMFLDHRAEFLRQLHADIRSIYRRALKENKLPVVRLNGTSDIAWEKIDPTLFSLYPGVTFYDYTKSRERMADSRLPGWPTNYHLTLSASEKDDASSIAGTVALGHNVAVVFRDKLPAKYAGYRVIDGTKNDWRFLDPKGVIVGLLAKGRAKTDTTGFVR